MAPGCSPLAAWASARSAWISMMLPTRGLGDRGRVQPFEQGKGTVGLRLREQHPRQHEVSGLSAIARLVVRVQSEFGRPPGGDGEVALGQVQPGLLGRDRAEQFSHRRIGDASGLRHRVQRAGGVASGVPGPGQRGQAVGQRVGNDELATERKALVEYPGGGVEVTALVGHPGHSNVRGACGEQAGLADRGAVIQGAPIGLVGAVQAALRQLDLAQVLAPPCDHLVHTGIPPPCDARTHRALSVVEPAAQPLC